MKKFKELREEAFLDGYMNIGHRKHADVTLWIYHNKRLRFYDTTTPQNITHDKAFPGTMRHNPIFGRIDHYQEKISAFIGLTDLSDAEIFSALYDLQKKYPNYEIMKFGFNNQFKGVFRI